VQRRLQQRRTLLLLDNVEQFDGQAVQALAHLLQSVAELRLLLTSRRLLGLDGEAVFDLPGLAMPSLQAILTSPKLHKVLGVASPVFDSGWATT